LYILNYITVNALSFLKTKKSQEETRRKSQLFTQRVPQPPSQRPTQQPSIENFNRGSSLQPQVSQPPSQRPTQQPTTVTFNRGSSFQTQPPSNFQSQKPSQQSPTESSQSTKRIIVRKKGEEIGFDIFLNDFSIMSLKEEIAKELDISENDIRSIIRNKKAYITKDSHVIGLEKEDILDIEL